MDTADQGSTPSRHRRRSSRSRNRTSTRIPHASIQGQPKAKQKRMMRRTPGRTSSRGHTRRQRRPAQIQLNTLGNFFGTLNILHLTIRRALRLQNRHNLVNDNIRRNLRLLRVRTMDHTFLNEDILYILLNIFTNNLIDGNTK